MRSVTQSPGSSRFITVNGVRLHALEYGEPSARPLVVVPGITSPAITWEFIAVELAREFHVVTLDVRGRGLSDKPSSGFVLADYAADTAGVIRGLELESPIVLGHSMGARITAALGTNYPGVAAALILADPPLSGPGRAEYPSPLPIYVEQLRLAQKGAQGENFRPYFPTWTKEQLDLRAMWLASCDETAVVESYHNFHREDFFDYWPQLRPPAVLLFGGKSPVIPESALPELKAANPHIPLVEIPRAGHMIPWDNLSGFLAQVRTFVSALPSQDV